MMKLSELLLAGDPFIYQFHLSAVMDMNPCYKCMLLSMSFYVFRQRLVELRGNTCVGCGDPSPSGELPK